MPRKGWSLVVAIGIMLAAAAPATARSPIVVAEPPPPPVEAPAPAPDQAPAPAEPLRCGLTYETHQANLRLADAAAERSRRRCGGCRKAPPVAGKIGLGLAGLVLLGVAWRGRRWPRGWLTRLVP